MVCTLVSPPRTGGGTTYRARKLAAAVALVQPFFSAARTWTVPQEINYGVTINSREMNTTSAYAGYFNSQLATDVAMGLDMYDFAPGQQALYTTVIGLFHSAPRGIFVEEFGPQAWTLDGGTTGGGCAIVGVQSCTWNAFNQNFLASLLPFLAAQGVADASLYSTEMLGACAPVYPDNARNNTVLNDATTAMQNRQYSLTSARLSTILSEWNMIGLHGCTLLNGSIMPSAR